MSPDQASYIHCMNVVSVVLRRSSITSNKERWYSAKEYIAYFKLDLLQESMNSGLIYTFAVCSEHGIISLYITALQLYLTEIAWSSWLRQPNQKMTPFGDLMLKEDYVMHPNTLKRREPKMACLLDCNNQIKKWHPLVTQCWRKVISCIQIHWKRREPNMHDKSQSSIYACLCLCAWWV